MIFSFSYFAIITFLVIILIIFVVIFSILSQSKQKISRLEFEKNLLIEKEREISLQMIKYQHEKQNLTEKNREINQELRYKTEKTEELQKEFLEKTHQLFQAKTRFEQEEERVRKTEEEKKQQAIDNYSTMWSEHEKKVISKLKEICISEFSSFTFYENTTLPPVFDGSLKPDFCVLYNDRYIVFDAKKSKNISQYIKDQIKITAKKYKEISEISRQIFFVIPDDEFQEISQKIYNSEGFTFIILSFSNIESTLFLLSKMQIIENLSDINPEERENIIHCISEYMQHVSVQNSVNILMAEKSFHLENSVQALPEDFTQYLEKKKNSSLPFSLQKAKSLAQKSSHQKEKIEKMKTPQIIL